MKNVRAYDFATDDYPRVAYDDLALDALKKMLASERNYAMVVEQGEIIGVIEQGDIVAAYGRGELESGTLVCELARDRPCIDTAASFDDVVKFMAAYDIFQICFDTKVLDDFMLLRAIWTERLAIAREFREYETPATYKTPPREEGSYGIGYG
ncbi:MAG: hypothetical protein Kow00129_04160 [Thermoleophilia bacterium]